MPILRATCRPTAAARRARSAMPATNPRMPTPPTAPGGSRRALRAGWDTDGLAVASVATVTGRSRTTARVADRPRSARSGATPRVSVVVRGAGCLGGVTRLVHRRSDDLRVRRRRTHDMHLPSDSLMRSNADDRRRRWPRMPDGSTLRRTGALRCLRGTAWPSGPAHPARPDRRCPPAAGATRRHVRP